jgi:hypothetical protein
LQKKEPFMDTFIVHHVHVMGDKEDVKLIGIYSSQQEAEAAIQRLQQQPGFSETPAGFTIGKYALNKDHWTEGFFTEYHQATLEDQIQELFYNITADLVAEARNNSFVHALFQLPQGNWHDIHELTKALPHIQEGLQQLQKRTAQLHPNMADEIIRVIWNEHPEDVDFVIITYYFAPTMLFNNVIYNKSLYEEK